MIAVCYLKFSENFVWYLEKQPILILTWIPGFSSNRSKGVAILLRETLEILNPITGQDETSGRFVGGTLLVNSDPEQSQLQISVVYSPPLNKSLIQIS